MPELILFVNDSHFAWRILEPVLASHAGAVKAIVVSTKTRGRIVRSFKVLVKCNRKYAIYRTLVDVVTRVNAMRGRGSAVTTAQALRIPLIFSADVNGDEKVLDAASTGGLGLAVNFDQLFKRSLLRQFTGGLYNLHASRLPNDKGISPALWAFARGDTEIWATIYEVDEGLDSGPVVEQYKAPVLDTDTAFSMYERVCSVGGRRLSRMLQDCLHGAKPRATPQAVGDGSAPWGWPDARFDALLRGSGRKLISSRDLLRALA